MVQPVGPRTRRPFNSAEHERAASLDRRAADAVMAEIAQTERRLASLREQYAVLVGFAEAHEQLADNEARRALWVTMNETESTGLKHG